jgi:hypothetical protein
MRGCRRHLTPSPRLWTTTSGEGGFGSLRPMSLWGLHGLCNLLNVRKEERLGGGTVERDVVDGQKVKRLRHQLANGLRLFVEDARCQTSADVRGVLNLGVPGRHILADVISPCLQLVQLLLGNAEQGRKRSLACGILLAKARENSAQVNAARLQVPAALARSSASSKALPF